MKNTAKRILLSAVLALCLLLAATSGLADTDVTGVWTLSAVSVEGFTMPLSILGENISITVTFSADGTGVMDASAAGESALTEVTWTQSGDRVRMSDNRDTLEMILEGEELHMEVEGVTMVFVRSGEAPASSARNSGTPAEGAALNMSQTGSNGVTITALGIRESSGSTSWNKAPDGKVYVLVNFEVENNTGDDYYVNTLFCFTAYQDGKELDSMDFGVFAEQQGELAKELENGQKAVGELGWPVDKDWQELEIRFTPQLFGRETLTFVLHRSDLAE